MGSSVFGVRTNAKYSLNEALDPADYRNRPMGGMRRFGELYTFCLRAQFPGIGWLAYFSPGHSVTEWNSQGRLQDWLQTNHLPVADYLRLESGKGIFWQY